MAHGGPVPIQASMTLIRVAGNDKAPVGECWRSLQAQCSHPDAMLHLWSQRLGQ